MRAAQETAPLELRSILRTGREYEFSLYDPSRKQSTWVGLNEPGHDFLVRDFDPAHDAVTVERRGRVYRLALKQATITPLAGTAVAAAAGTTPTQAGRRLLPNNPAILRRIELQREALARARTEAQSEQQN